MIFFYKFKEKLQISQYNNTTFEMRGKASEIPKKYSLNTQNSESRKKLSSFEHENSEELEGSNNNFEIKPLSTKFYSNLLRLEEKVSSRKFDIETLNEIVSIYAVYFYKIFFF